MKLLIFGSTGSIGRLLIKQALEQGHTVTAFTRDATKVDIKHNNLQVTRGDVMDPASVERAIQGHEVVLCSLGAGRKGTVRGNTKYHQRDGEAGRPTFNLPVDPWSRR